MPLQPSPHLDCSSELRFSALHLLVATEPRQKAEQVIALRAAWQTGSISLAADEQLAAIADIPGRPARPELVEPLLVPRRPMNTAQGRAALIHALAHIEFNAINLALDAVWRFPGMPRAYYDDWIQVAAEEALHFSLLAAHLNTLGFAYGEFPAHNSLWEMAEKTQHDLLARIALVPRTLEARGLDATPGVRAKLAQAGDQNAAEILDIILRDEIGHVAVGNRWYGWLCEQKKADPVATYAELAERYKAPRMHGPFNLEARRQAGFSEAELNALRTA
ncbi:MAG: ferritin-like domain-containing protein [Burkholderiales bacterium]|nr:ferritin-like domain-containing protein [Burkholderiales bacterium]